jgi:signal transduction histidine kinase
MELLGTMSRGIAHDLNNLLTPISTFLQMAGANENNRAVWEELLPSAMRNLDTIRAYVRESLFFSKTQRLQLRAFKLDRAIQGGIDLALAGLKEKDMTVATQGPSEVEVEMDEVLIQRLLGNLLSNAIDASPPGSQIQISLDRLTKTRTDCEWLRVRVIDHGVGISPENLKRVATPYFTTKDRGDHRRGFGLGLAICRKIVLLHGGHLSIVSEENVGTTVQVDLPDRQIAPKHARIPVSS